MELNDPIGQAILEYAAKNKPADIVVSSDLCDDDIIPVETLFRTYLDMPELEQKALSLCKGKILDVGAGAGAHSLYLIQNGFDVTPLEISKGACQYLETLNLNPLLCDFNQLKTGSYDTILMLMNGIGMAGQLAHLKKTLIHASSLLSKSGQILCDSSDVSFLYEEEDGSFWTDLNSGYFGDFKFQMHYKKHNSAPFDWLYVDYDTLHKIGEEAGFKCQRIAESEHHYLAQLIKT